MVATHSKWITLQTPIERDGQEPITTIRLRMPKARDIVDAGNFPLSDILRMNVGAMVALTGKLAEPYIVKAEAEAIDVADLVTISSALVGFFLDPVDAAELGATASAEAE